MIHPWLALEIFSRAGNKAGLAIPLSNPGRNSYFLTYSCPRRVLSYFKNNTFRLCTLLSVRIRMMYVPLGILVPFLSVPFQYT